MPLHMGQNRAQALLIRITDGRKVIAEERRMRAAVFKDQPARCATKLEEMDRLSLLLDEFEGVIKEAQSRQEDFFPSPD